MKLTATFRRVALSGCVLALVGGMVGCAAPRPPLYLWESFPKMQYETLRNNGNSPSEQLAQMEEQVEKARAKNAALPPGFRAHLGMLKLAAGDADQARSLWQAEKTAFPESAPYMDQLLKRLDQPVKKDPA